jgi:hypothetical protein
LNHIEVVRNFFIIFSITAKNFPNHASVSRHVAFPERAVSKTGNSNLSFYSMNRWNFIQGHCDCGAQQQQWYLFDPLHAYAEYIIEYEYLFSVR